MRWRKVYTCPSAPADSALFRTHRRSRQRRQRAGADDAAAASQPKSPPKTSPSSPAGAAGYQTLKTDHARIDCLMFLSKTLPSTFSRTSYGFFSIYTLSGHWRAGTDTKLAELHKLIAKSTATKKFLVFSQFADTVDYLNAEIEKIDVKRTRCRDWQPIDDPSRLIA